MGYCPALRYPFGGVGSNSIPSPVKRIQTPQSQLISDDDEDEWEVIAEYATNHQQAMDAHEIIDDIYRHAKILGSYNFFPPFGKTGKSHFSQLPHFPLFPLFLFPLSELPL